MLVQTPNFGWLLASKRRGVSHKRSGKPCQDAYAYSKSPPGQRYWALAVADGHGDVQHDLSEHGAKLAVTVAVKKLLEFADHFDNSSITLKNNFKHDFPRLLGREWRKAVLKDATQRFSSVNPNNPQDIYQLLNRYGTTLLVALILPGMLLVGQIGDGDLLRLYPDGQIDSPFNHDKTLVANATHSLSSPEADKVWQTAVLQRQAGEALLLATDGLSNAFRDETQFHTFARSLLTRFDQFGLAAVDQALPRWLDDYSAKGSGDDITLLIFREDLEAG
jgi:serine/threonine protein phosphatase PrpC